MINLQISANVSIYVIACWKMRLIQSKQIQTHRRTNTHFAREFFDYRSIALSFNQHLYLLAMIRDHSFSWMS